MNSEQLKSFAAHPAHRDSDVTYIPGTEVVEFAEVLTKDGWVTYDNDELKADLAEWREGSENEGGWREF